MKQLGRVAVNTWALAWVVNNNDDNNAANMPTEYLLLNFMLFIQLFYTLR